LHLAVFDIDGTLTRSSDADADCFVRAFAEGLDLREIDTDWSSYEHATDSSIAIEIFSARRGRPPTPEELGGLKLRFQALLETEIRAGRASIEPVPGAAAALEALRANPGWAIAIATGSWRASARLKLEAAKLPVRGIPLATADDALSRAEIVRTACASSHRLHGIERFDRVVLIGDAPWDVQTAAELGYPLIGIAIEGSRDILERSGTTVVLEDYLDLERFLRALRTAAVPRGRHR
jgi:phosphoglycolate phosphatase-like HAD superfamily hydrolase